MRRFSCSRNSRHLTDAPLQVFSLILLLALLFGAAGIAVARPTAAADPRAITCRRTIVVQTVRRFLVAINHGDIESADRLVARGAAFKWYAVGGQAGRRLGTSATRRSTLRAYLLARYRQSEQFRLVRLRYHGTTERRYGNFNFDVLRHARDFPARTVTGKGALDCRLSPAKIAVWVIGR